MKCKHCGTTDNIITSGVDAFILGATTEDTCYGCAKANNTRPRIQNLSIKWERKTLAEQGYPLTDDEWDDFCRALNDTAQVWFEERGM